MAVTMCRALTQGDWQELLTAAVAMLVLSAMIVVAATVGQLYLAYVGVLLAGLITSINTALLSVAPSGLPGNLTVVPPVVPTDLLVPSVCASLSACAALATTVFSMLWLGIVIVAGCLWLLQVRIPGKCIRHPSHAGMQAHATDTFIQRRGCGLPGRVPHYTQVPILALGLVLYRQLRQQDGMAAGTVGPYNGDVMLLTLNGGQGTPVTHMAKQELGDEDAPYYSGGAVAGRGDEEGGAGRVRPSPSIATIDLSEAASTPLSTVALESPGGLGTGTSAGGRKSDAGVYTFFS
jgi:hypothetical protein